MEYPLQRLHLLCQISTLSYIDWVSSRPIRLFIVILMYNYWRYSHIYTGKCENYEFTCGNGKCLSKFLRCHGGNFCGDNADEQQCRKCVFTNTSVLYCNHLSSGLMANSILLFKPVLTMSRYKQILSFNLSIFSSHINEIIIATLMWTK